MSMLSRAGPLIIIAGWAYACAAERRPAENVPIHDEDGDAGAECNVLRCRSKVKSLLLSNNVSVPNNLKAFGKLYHMSRHRCNETYVLPVPDSKSKVKVLCDRDSKWYEVAQRIFSPWRYVYIKCSCRYVTITVRSVISTRA
eukprot:TRINITY_DN31547_c0_g1_i1.p1 TRINITY_DN31547_c0_g1~~TRINITY_DN31547_c0_g1_i1.p1  ORF type:complete len:142 (+),score=4.95 TRINITY_DN31547_c0_g1_i1:66-491(+)